MPSSGDGWTMKYIFLYGIVLLGGIQPFGALTLQIATCKVKIPCIKLRRLSHPSRIPIFLPCASDSPVSAAVSLPCV